MAKSLTDMVVVKYEIDDSDPENGKNIFWQEFIEIELLIFFSSNISCRFRMVVKSILCEKSTTQ